MVTSQDQSTPSSTPHLAALPMFAAPPARTTDHPLPVVEPSLSSPPGSSPSGDPSPSRAAGDDSGADPDTATDPSSGGGPWSRRTNTSTDRLTWRPGGDPAQVAVVIGGLLILTIGALGRLANRRGRDVRQPTPAQRDQMARPLARIACRHLPMNALGPDLADAAEAVVAADNWVHDGPLITYMTPDLGEIPDHETD